MKRLLFLLGMLLLAPPLHGEGDPDDYLLDSLQVMLDNARPGPDKIDVLLGLTRIHMLKGNSPKAIAYVNEAMRIANRLENLDLRSECLNFIAQIEYQNSGKYYETSRQAMDLALRSGSTDAVAFTTYVWVEFGDYSPERGIELLEGILKDSVQISPKNLGNIYKAIAWEYEKNGQFVEAEQSYRKACRIFASFQLDLPVDPRLGRVSAQYIDRGLGNLLQSHLYLGEMLMKRGQYTQAIEEGEMGMRIAEQTNSFDVAYAHMYLGDFYATAGDVSPALEHYEQSRKIYEILTDKKWIGRVLTRLGNLFYTTHDYDQALYSFMQAYEIIQVFPDEAADLTLRIGRVYELENNDDLALQMYLRADSTFLSIGDTLSSYESKIQVAKLYSQVDNNQRGKQIILDLLPKLEQIQDVNLLQTAFIGLANIEEEAGEYRDAIGHATQALEIAKRYRVGKTRLQSAHFLLSRLYEKLGDFGRA